jgi:signal transduction histidine kinase
LDINSMTNKFFGSISIRIFLAVFLTTFLITIFSSFYQIVRVNIAFDQFLSRQEQEMAEMGWMRNMMEVDRLRRLEALNSQFKNAIIQNTLMAGITGALAAMLTAGLVAKNITRPLSMMENGINDVMENKLRGRLEEEGPLEVQELIKRFNQLLEELDRIEKLRADLVSDVMHELRTPVTKIQGQLEGIEDGIYEANPKLIKNLLDNTKQLEAIISRLQELIEIRSGVIKLKKVKVDIEEMLNSIVSGYSKEGVKIVKKIENGLKLKVDPIRFRELLENLIGNAFKYTQKGEISVVASDEYIKVSDTGIGIPKDELSNIFERFYRVDKSRSIETGGLGLGLAIAKEIAEAHGFNISVESELNKGSVFTITF